MMYSHNFHLCVWVFFSRTYFIEMANTTTCACTYVLLVRYKSVDMCQLRVLTMKLLACLYILYIYLRWYCCMFVSVYKRT